MAQLMSPLIRLLLAIVGRHHAVPAGREAVERVVIFLGGQAKLLQVVLAPGPVSRFASRLDRGQEERHQHADDGDDHEQLDQGEAG